MLYNKFMGVYRMFEAFNQGIQRLGTGCIKWDFREQEFGNVDVIPFSIADADYPSCPEIQQVLVEHIRNNVLGYTDLDGGYLDAVRRWCRERHDWPVEADWITSTAGVVPAVSAAIAALLPAGAQIITQTPLYDPFESVIAANHCTCVHNPLIRDKAGRYTMDLEQLEQCMRGGASMMILCNPHNPVGRVWSRQELSAVLELCRAYGVILVSDEIHWDIILPGYHHTTLGKLVTEEDNVIICTAPSKTFNIAGLQTSNIIIPKPTLRARFQNWLFSRYLFGANVLGLKACAAAYTYGADWADEQNRFLSQNAAFVYQYMAQHIPQAVVTPLEGTYLMWMDLSFLGRTSEELVQEIARQGAGVNSGRHYGPQCDGFIRLNIACPQSQLEQGLDCIRRAVRSLSGQSADTTGKEPQTV